MATEGLAGEIGWTPAAFTLPATDGKSYRLSDIAGARGTVIAFICNHCPYVVAVAERMVRDLAELQGEAIGAAAICANDPVTHPADSFDNMAVFAREHGFTFPYLHDAEQSVARAFGAVCTPEFFGFDADLTLRYRRRLAAGRPGQPAPERRELVEAMRQVAQGVTPAGQQAAMGCSIKWRAA